MSRSIILSSSGEYSCHVDRRRSLVLVNSFLIGGTMNKIMPWRLGMKLKKKNKLLQAKSHSVSIVTRMKKNRALQRRTSLDLENLSLEENLSPEVKHPLTKIGLTSTMTLVTQ